MDLKALCVPRSPGFTKTLRIMKLTAIIMLAALMQVSARGDAQMVSINVKNAPLTKVFSLIENQTDYVFFFDATLMKETKPVTLSVKNGTIESILKESLKDQPVDYLIENKTITIIRKQKSQNPNSNILSPPTDIHGRVTDSTGMPIQGASVTIKGTKKGTNTDADGAFTLKDVGDDATLVISFVGYETQQVRISGRTVIVVSLRRVVVSMHDVVISKGYYNTTQALNTGDATVVSGADINKQPVSDPIMALEGRVPGLYIAQASGIPGASYSIMLRGQNSIANGNHPLYIVDGVPFISLSLTNSGIGGGALGMPSSNNAYSNSNSGQGMSPFNSLNPADIESIEVLKDADATAIYGSRGANGVILITTKKGKAGDTRVNVDFNSGEGNIAHFIPMLNTRQYLQMRHEAFKNDGVLPGPTDYDVNGTWDTTRYTNWEKVLLGGTARYTTANASLSGGNANTQFVLGGGYSRQTTVYPGDFSDRRVSVHLNLTHTSADQKLHISFTAQYSADNSNMPQVDFAGLIRNLAPDAPPIYDANGNLNWQNNTWGNPLQSTLLTAGAVTDNLASTLNFNYEVLPGLKIGGKMGYTRMQMDQTLITPASAFPGPPNPYNRFNEQATGVDATWVIEPQISYTRQIGKGRFDALIGSTIQDEINSAISYYGYDFTSDALISNPANAGTTTIYTDTYFEYRYNGLYGRLNYTWNDKYEVNATAKRDGSSRFGPGNEFGNFGAVGAAWIFGKETFIQKSLSFLSFGKLRGSYGTTGNDQINNYQYLSSYGASGIYQGTAGLAPNQIASPYFAWERVNKLEGGLELGFLRDRIMLSTSWYNNRTGNQLVGESLPGQDGFAIIQANLPAVVQNSGFEIELKTVNIKSGGFNWNSSFNISIQRNKLVSFPGLASNPYYKDVYVVGQPILGGNTSKTYQYTGVDPQTGLYTLRDLNGDGILTNADKEIGKYVHQDYFGGFSNTFNYKGLSLDVFFQFVKQTGRNLLYSFGGYSGAANSNVPVYILNHVWHQPGDQAQFGRLTTYYGPTGSLVGQSGGNVYQSDLMLSDASFIRLKNVSLSWTLPANWQHAARMKDARIYLQGQNLLTFTKYLGFDPKSQSMSLPPLRMVSLGFHGTF